MKLKVIYNNVLPFKGYKAINLFGLCFVRKDAGEFTDTNYNHELIHSYQQRELAWVPFYIIYVFEWLFRLIFHTATAYRGILFEQEAYDNQADLNYTATRKPYAMWRRKK